jgi:hypothetical protein
MEIKKLTPEDFINGKIDEKSLQVIAEKLTQLPEEERFSAIELLLQHRNFSIQKIGLFFVKICIHDEEINKKILEIALDVGDASWIRYWLETVIPKLGFHKIMSILKDNLQIKPIGVDKALYWLAWLIPEDDKDSGSEYLDLIKQAKKLNVIVYTVKQSHPD